MAIISVKNVSFSYNKDKSVKKALDCVNFEVKEGEFLGIIGHTGSGKSTLLQMFNGLLTPDEGEILFEGKNCLIDKKARYHLRFNVGLVFQYPEYQLFEETVKKDVAFGPKNMGLSEEQIQKRVLNAMKSVGLPLDVLDKSPFELSGGQMRRVAIAGVVAMKPKVLVLDEPTAGLDPIGKREILELLKRIHSSSRNTIIMVSHDMEEVAKISNRVLILNRGEVFSIGDPKSIFGEKEELEKVGLSIPQMSQVFWNLRSNGFELSKDVYTVDQAVKEIKLYLKKRGRHS